METLGEDNPPPYFAKELQYYSVVRKSTLMSALVFIFHFLISLLLIVPRLGQRKQLSEVFRVMKCLKAEDSTEPPIGCSCSNFLCCKKYRVCSPRSSCCSLMPTQPRSDEHKRMLPASLTSPPHGRMRWDEFIHFIQSSVWPFPP